MHDEEKCAPYMRRQWQIVRTGALAPTCTEGPGESLAVRAKDQETGELYMQVLSCLVFMTEHPDQIEQMAKRLVVELGTRVATGMGPDELSAMIEKEGQHEH